MTDQVDGSGRSPTKDSGRSPSTSVDSGGGVATFESCLCIVLARAFRFGSLEAETRRLGEGVFRGGDGNCLPAVGDSTITDCLCFGGDVFNAGTAGVDVAKATADRLRVTL